MQKTKRPLSLLLTFALLISLFAGLTFGVSADGGQKVEAVTSLEDGGLYIIADTDGKYAMSVKNPTGNTSCRAAVAIEVTDGVLTAGDSDLSDLIWTCTNDTEGMKLGNGGLYLTANYSYLYAQETPGSYCNTWALNGGILRSTKSNYATYCVKYEAGSGFKNASASSTAITLYKVTLCDHANKTNEQTVDADCTTDGSHSFHCTDCGQDIVETIPALGHKSVLKSETSTYWEYQCTRCGVTYQIDKDERLKAMTLTGVIATFSTDGTYEWAYDAENSRLQSRNQGKGSTNSITTITFSAERAFNLSFDYSVNSESYYDFLTLTLDGTQLACTKVSGKNGQTLSFSYPETELTAGSHTLKLDYCKDSGGNQGEDSAYLSNLVAAVACDHDWVQGETIAPTCTEDGYTTYTCSKCGNSKQDDATAALGHIRGDVCTDNGDGTHSYNCTRTEDCPGGTEAHTYVDGVCTVCGAAEPVVIGNTTSTSTSGYPYYAGMKNSTTQVIYTAEEIGKAGTISAIAYDVVKASSVSTTSVKVYMAHTDKDKFASASDYLNTTIGLELVYEGTPTLGEETGWEMLALDTPFFYNGVDNLVIAVARTSNSTVSSLSYRCTSGTDRCLYRGGATDNYGNVDSTIAYSKVSAYVPNVQLYVAEHTHNWQQGTPVAAACLTEGYTPVTCTDCGTATKQDVQAALGHDFGTDGVCTRCGLRNITEYADLFYAVEPYFDLSGTEAAAEKWTAAVYEQDPVAKSSGTNTIKLTALDTGTLTVCAAQMNAAGSSYYKDYGYITITVKDAGGSTVGTVQKIENATAALTFETVQVRVEAGQTVEIYCYCKSAAYFQYMKALAFTPDCVHEHAADDAGTVTAPTCTERGYTTYTCTECENTYRADYTAPTGHDYGEVCVEPTCTEKGSLTQTCQREGCTSVIVTEIPANGHNFENGYCTVCHEKAASFVQIGESTTGHYYTPYGTAQYSSSQLLYTADKVGSGGTITGIAFNVTNASTGTANTLKVYMGHKSASAFSSADDKLTTKDLTLVYDHTNVKFGEAKGWEALTLDTPFTYNGTDSLVIVIAVGKTGTTWDTKYAYTATAGSEMHTYSSTASAIADVDSITNYTVSTYLPDIQITFKAENSAHPGALTAVEATGDCVSGGVLAHWECGVCHKLFSDAEGKTETTLEALTLPAGGEHRYENGVCTVCGARETAAEVAKVGENTYASLAEAVAAAGAGDTVTLLADVSEKLVIDKSLTLDLGGHTLTGTLIESKNAAGTVIAKDIVALQVSAGTVTVKNGTVAGRVNVYDAANVTIDSTLTITNHEVDGFTASGIVVWGDGTFGAEGCKTPTLNFSGKITVTGNAFGITTNGTDKSHPVIVVADGAEITADTDGIGIYLPAGSLSVTGGTVTGATAIYFKSTDMAISGGTFRGIGAKADYGYYGNGANATGDAIVIDNCNYPNGVGTVAVTGGSFHSENAAPLASYAGNGQETALTGFVSGGTFNKAIDNALCASGFECVGDAENGYGIEKASADPFVLEAAKGEDGTITVTVKAAKAFEFSVMELTLRCTYGGAVLQSITSDYADASSVNTETGYAGLYAAEDTVSVAAGDVLAVYTYTADGDDFRFRLSTGDCYAGTGDDDKLPWSADYTGEDKIDEFPIAELGNPGEDPTGFTVTVEDKNTGAVIAGLDGLKLGETTFTVKNDKACVVLVRNGETYTRLTAVPTAEENTYSFTLNVTADTTVVVALKGDVNGDGKVNSADSMLVSRSCLSETQTLYQALNALEAVLADVNADGKVNSADSVLISRSCLSTEQSLYQALTW